MEEIDMKVKDLVEMVGKGHVISAAKLSEFLRFRYGWSYTEIYEFVSDRTDIDLATWDSMLGEAEELGY
jgi:hypothetical protein